MGQNGIQSYPSDLLLEYMGTSILLLAVSKIDQLVTNRKYNPILNFSVHAVMLFSAENVIDAFVAMADKDECLQNEGSTTENFIKLPNKYRS